jgi:hypothetical protein
LVENHVKQYIGPHIGKCTIIGTYCKPWPVEQKGSVTTESNSHVALCAYLL